MTQLEMLERIVSGLNQANAVGLFPDFGCLLVTKPSEGTGELHVTIVETQESFGIKVLKDN